MTYHFDERKQGSAGEDTTMEYSNEMSVKIIRASEKELEAISSDIEMEVYENLTAEAKARLSKYIGGIL